MSVATMAASSRLGLAALVCIGTLLEVDVCRARSRATTTTTV